MLSKNEVKDITKLINSLENRGILLKNTKEKVTNQNVEFLGPLIKVGLKMYLRHQRFDTIKINESSVSSRSIYSKENLWIRNYNIDKVKQRNERYIIKIVKNFEGLGLLIKGVSGSIENEAKEQKGGFLDMLIGTLGASLL